MFDRFLLTLPFLVIGVATIWFATDDAPSVGNRRFRCLGRRAFSLASP